MNKIISVIIAHVIYRTDTVLYRTFGIVSSFRKQFWVRQGERLQADLDREHSKRDLVNSVFGHNYTTKKALETYYRDEVSLMEW